MNNNEYTTIGLYDHNADSYNQVKSSFESGNDVEQLFMQLELVNHIMHCN